MLIDDDIFFNPKIPEQILKTFGWNIKTPIIQKGILFFKADFYEDGFVLADRKNAIITSEGETLFYINDKKYTSISTAMKELGFSILESINTWDWRIEKEWVVTKKNGIFITTFSKLYECPLKVR
mgnify:FL=1|tara:strand:+ start:1248 stop:1622 length:375 start_codon:yes stop_codon:yes gene_type:complete